MANIFEDAKKNSFILETSSIHITTQDLTTLLAAILAFRDNNLTFMAADSESEKISAATKVMVSYKAIITALSADVISKLRLFFDDDLASRLIHLYALASDALTSSETSLTFIESYAIDDKFKLAFDADLLTAADLIVTDYTSDATLLEVKANALSATFPSPFKCASKLIEDRLLLKPVLNARSVLKAFSSAVVNPELSVATEEILGERADNLDLIAEDIIAALVSPFEIESGKNTELAHLSDYEYMTHFNTAESIAAFERLCSGTEAYAILKKYLDNRIDMGIKERDLMRMPPVAAHLPADLAAEGSDPMSVFILALRSIEATDIWFEYKQETGFIISAFKMKRVKPSTVLTSADKPDAYVRKVSESTFDIIFNVETFMRDWHIADSISRYVTKPEERIIAKRERASAIASSLKPSTVAEYYTRAVSEFKDYAKMIEDESSLGVFAKILSMASELVPTMKLATFETILSKVFKVVAQTKIARSIAHEYEVAKSVAASFKVPVGYHRYFLSQNGTFDSVSLIQRNCTSESFSNVFTLTAYRPIASTKWVTFKSISFNKNTLEWAIKKPFTFFASAAWMFETRSSGMVPMQNLTYDMAFMACYISVNRDNFAQVSDLVRYSYTAATSFGTSITDILKKMEPLAPASAIEVMYAIHMIKTVTALETLRDHGYLKWLKGETGACFVMPQDRDMTTSFSYFVSSMYISRLYNKNKAFPEIAEAMCYNAILEEIAIFNSSSDLEPVVVMEEWRKDLKRCISKAGSRFVGSPASVMALARKYRTAKSLKSAVMTADIATFSTNKAAMSGSEADSSHQVTKSFLNAMTMPQRFCPDKDFRKIPTSVYYQNMISIIDWAQNHSFEYAAYIVKKDQVGSREIYVMNYYMRLGTFLVEEIARAYSYGDEVNVQSVSNKEVVMESIMKKAHEVRTSSREAALEIYDNADAKRWGPNQRMDVLAALMAGILTEQDYDLGFMSLFTFSMMMNKRVKVPHSLLALFNTVESTEGKGVAFKFLRDNAALLSSPRPAVVEKMGMGQGIFQEFSSVLHSVKQKVEIAVLKKTLGARLAYASALVTSDDSFKVLVLKVGSEFAAARSPLWKKIIDTSIRVGSVFSILRNLAKSSLDINKAEFNSRFYYRRSPALPTLKFINAKIEVGMGSDMTQDMIHVLESANEYISAAGSFTGAYNLIVTNYALFLEHWRLTYAALRDLPGSFSAVGYLARIEPISIYCTSAQFFMILSDYSRLMSIPFSDINPSSLSSLAMKLSSVIDSSMKKITMVTQRKLTGEETEEGYEQEAFTFYSSIIGMRRTPRMRSKYEKSDVSKQFSCMVPSYSLLKRAGGLAALWTRTDLRARQATNQIEDIDFASRFADPWTSRDRKAMIKNSEDFMAPCLRDLADTFTLNELLDVLKSDTIARKYSDLIAAPDPIYEADTITRHIKDVFQSWFTMILQIYKLLLEMDSSKMTLQKKDMPTCMTRIIAGSSIWFTEKLTATSEVLCKLLGAAAMPYAVQVNTNLPRLRSLAEACTAPVPISEAFSRVEALVNKLSLLNPPKKRIIIASDFPSATPGDIFTHIIRDRYMEGMGFTKAVIQRYAIEEPLRPEVSLDETDRKITTLLAEEVAAHINDIAKGVSSDLKARLIKKFATNELFDMMMDQRARELLNPYKILVTKILFALVKDTSPDLTLEEKLALMNGSLTAATQVEMISSKLRFYFSSETAMEHNRILGHLVESVHGKFNHHILFAGTRQAHRVTSLTFSKVAASLSPLKAHAWTNGMSSGPDQVFFHYPDTLIFGSPIIAPYSSMVMLPFAGTVIPLFTLQPDVEKLSLFTIKRQRKYFEFSERIMSDLESEAYLNPEADPVTAVVAKVTSDLRSCTDKEIIQGACAIFSHSFASVIRTDTVTSLAANMFSVDTTPYLERPAVEVAIAQGNITEAVATSGPEEDTFASLGFSMEDMMDIAAAFEPNAPAEPIEPPEAPQVDIMDLIAGMEEVMDISTGDRKPAEVVPKPASVCLTSVKSFLRSIKIHLTRVITANFKKPYIKVMKSASHRILNAILVDLADSLDAKVPLAKRMLYVALLANCSV